MVQGFLDAHKIDPAGLVVVADAGMMSQANLTALDEAGVSFIVGSKTTRAPYDLAEHASFHGHAYSDGELVEITTAKRGVGSAAGGAPKVRHRPAWDPGKDPDSWRVVCRYSRKRYAHDTHTLTIRENKARAVIDGQAASRRPRFVNGARHSLSLDEKALVRARAAAGLNCYVTNMTAARIDAGEVVASYRRLWHVEQSWRMSKHDLRARPVFHHKRDASQAHLTMVTAALAVARFLQDATGMSIKRIIRTLLPLREVTISLNGHCLVAHPQITAEAADILDALEIDLAH